MGPDVVEAVTGGESSRAAATPAVASVPVPIRPSPVGQSEGLDADVMTRITGATDSHLTGSARQFAEESRMRQRTGLVTDEQLQAATEPFLAPVLDSGRYPAFARWLRGRTPAGAAGQFDYTLGWLLDGIAAHLA